jgi:hypothetical protein
MHCVSRVLSFGFRRSLHLSYLREFSRRAGWDKFVFTMRLAKMTNHFHNLIEVKPGQTKGLTRRPRGGGPRSSKPIGRRQSQQNQEHSENPNARGRRREWPRKCHRGNRGVFSLTTVTDITPAIVIKFLLIPLASMSSFIESYIPWPKDLRPYQRL